MTGGPFVERWLAAAFFLMAPIGTLVGRGMAPLGIATGIILVGFLTWRRPQVLGQARGPLLLVGALIAWSAISLMWTPATPRAYQTVAEQAYTLLPPLIAISGVPLLGHRRRALVEDAFVVGGVVGLVLLTLHLVIGPPFYSLYTGAQAGDLHRTQAVDMGATVLALTIWPLAMLVERWRRPRDAAALVVIFFVIACGSTSHASILATVVGAGVFGIATWSPRAARLVLGGVATLGFLLAMPLGHAFYALGLASAPQLFASARHRVEIWNYAAGEITRAPWLGHGIDAARVYASRELPLHPHDVFLQVWLELGAVGAAIGLAIMIAAIYASRVLELSAQRFALASTGAALVFLAVSFGVWQPWWMATEMLTLLVFAALARRPGVEMGGTSGARAPQADSVSSGGGQRTPIEAEG